MQHARAEELIHLDINAALEGREFATVFPQRPEFDSFEAPVLLHVRRVSAHPITISASNVAPSGSLRTVFLAVGPIYR